MGRIGGAPEFDLADWPRCAAAGRAVPATQGSDSLGPASRHRAVAASRAPDLSVADRVRHGCSGARPPRKITVSAC